MTQLIYQVTALSDVGLSRSLNEDSLLVDGDLGLFAVADGMGGHSAGDLASSSVVSHLQKQIRSCLENRSENPSQSNHYNDLEQSVESCNELILSMNEEKGMPIGSGMGTTLVGLYLLPKKNEAVLFNVGDSRVYRLRETEMVQITKDHTMYQHWLESGQKGEAPSKNILINAIGLLESIRTDLTLEKMQAGDVYLICSDGLTTNLADSDLMDSLSKSKDGSDSDTCSDLIGKANQAGGDDNTTVIVVSVVEAEQEATDVALRIQTTVLPERVVPGSAEDGSEELQATVKRSAIKESNESQ